MLAQRNTFSLIVILMFQKDIILMLIILNNNHHKYIVVPFTGCIQNMIENNIMQVENILPH